MTMMSQIRIRLAIDITSIHTQQIWYFFSLFVSVSILFCYGRYRVRFVIIPNLLSTLIIIDFLLLAGVLLHWHSLLTLLWLMSIVQKFNINTFDVCRYAIVWRYCGWHYASTGTAGCTAKSAVLCEFNVNIDLCDTGELCRRLFHCRWVWQIFLFSNKFKFSKTMWKTIATKNLERAIWVVAYDFFFHFKLILYYRIEIRFL